MNRRMQMSRLMVGVLFVALFGVSAPAHAEWVRWLGPNQDGTTLGNDLFPTEEFGLEVAWSRPLGVAYSGIAVADGRAVTLFADGEFDWMTAVDAKTGKELWRYKIDTWYEAHDGSEGGASSAPVIDDGVVFGLGAKGHLFAVKLDDGEELWSLRIDEELGARPPRYGFATTPDGKASVVHRRRSGRLRLGRCGHACRPRADRRRHQSGGSRAGPVDRRGPVEPRARHGARGRGRLLHADPAR